MDHFSAFAMGEANRHKEQRVFDWDKAARVMKSKGVKNAYAGLQGDLEYTRGAILIDGEPAGKDVCMHLASTWAKPVLILSDDADWEAQIECWVMASEVPDSWEGEHAYINWPESARRVMGFSPEQKP